MEDQNELLIKLEAGPSGWLLSKNKEMRTHDVFLNFKNRLMKKSAVVSDFETTVSRTSTGQVFCTFRLNKYFRYLKKKLSETLTSKEVMIADFEVVATSTKAELENL